MLRTVLALLVAGFLALFTTPTVQKGFQDLMQSITHLGYYPIRDMRRSVSLAPQKGADRLPDAASVPTTGREPVIDRDLAAERLRNPVPATRASVAMGDTLFRRLCTPCHGMTMAGDGTVSPNFMPPPDLLAQQTRERRDGYIYSYIRAGGVVMPSYGSQLSAEEAWHVVNYIRSMQKASPR